MVFLLTLLGIFKYLLIGLALLFILQKNSFVIEKLSTSFTIVYSFLIGVLLSSIVLHIGLVLNCMSLMHLFIWILALISILYILVFQKAKLLQVLKEVNILIFGIFSVGYLWQALLLASQPVIANDARGIWLLKTKALIQGASSFFEYMQSTLYTYSHIDYPISIPLLYADILKPLGSFWEPAIGILSFTFFFMLMLGIYGAIRHYTRLNSLVTLLITCVIFFTPEYLRQGWAGLSDVPLSLAFFGVILSLLLTKNYLRPKEFLLPLSFAIFAATIKNEGITFLLITIVTIGLQVVTSAIKEKKALRMSFFHQVWLPATALVIALVPLVTWKVLLMKYSISNDIVSAPNLSQIASRIPVLVSEVTPRLLDGFRFGILFVPALILLALPILKKTESQRWSLIIAGQALVYLAIYMITPHDLTWHISTSFSRLLLHLLPALYLVMLAHRSTKSIV